MRVTSPNTLGDYLRARRELVDPRDMWARHDVKALAGAPVRMNHPRAGVLDLRREKLPIGDSGGQLLVIYHAEPVSDTAAALARLASGQPGAGGSGGEQPAGVSGLAGGGASGYRG